jgi:RNA polymerase sigma-70 factor (ECF subfamily)
LFVASIEDEAARTPQLRDLTAKLARGDNTAWDQFHREYGPQIFRHLLAITRGDHDLATEALQQAYLRIARHARRCDDAAAFQSWLRIVARSALSDCRRARHRFWTLLHRHAVEATPPAIADADDARLEAALDNALAQVEPETRSLLQAKYFRGLPIAAIAEELSVSPKAIESRLTRARADLRARIVALLADK